MKGVIIMKIGERIRERRQSLGLTLEDVANKSGVSRQTIQRYESGVISNIPSDRIEMIAHALSVSPPYLMGWDDEVSVNDNYYLDPEVAEIAQAIKENPGKRALFDATRDVSKEDIEKVLQIINVITKDD